MNCRLFPIIKIKDIRSLSIIISFFIILFLFSYCRKSKSFNFPIYQTAENITDFSFKNVSTGLYYFVKLKYPNEIDTIYDFYENELKKSGWKQGNTNKKAWKCFIDVTNKKVCYLSARWLKEDIKKEMRLFIRYEIDVNKKRTPIIIQQTVYLEIISYAYTSKSNIGQQIKKDISGIKEISEIRNKISLYLGHSVPFGGEKKAGYKEVVFVPFGSKHKDVESWLIREQVVLTQTHIETIQLIESDMFPKKYNILFKFNPEGANQMREATKEVAEDKPIKQFVIFVNDSPILNAMISNKMCNEAILGPWEKKEAEKLFSILSKN